MISAGIIGFNKLSNKNKTPIPISNKSNSTENINKYCKIIEGLTDNIDEYNIFYMTHDDKIASHELSDEAKEIAQKLCNILHIRKQLKMTEINEIISKFKGNPEIQISAIITKYNVLPTISLNPDSELNEDKLLELIEYLTHIDYKNYKFHEQDEKIYSFLPEDKISTLLQKLTDVVYIRENLGLSVEKTIPRVRSDIHEILKHYSITPSDKYTRIFTVNL